MLARTLLQPALPTTFGAKAAGWLVGVLEARRLVDDASSHLSVSLGGAAGTLAAFEAEGPAVLTEFAERLDLAKPLVPWHTSRQRVASLGAALATAAGTAAKITGDIALLMQAEVAEVAVTQPGGSSTLPHKRNPVAAALTDAAARRSAALASVLVSSVVSEHERPLGAWHAEWVPFAELLALSGGAVANAAATVSRLEIFPEAMKANVERIGPVLLSERMMFALTALVGRNMAVSILADATASSDFAAAVAQDPRVAGVLAADRLAELLDPLGYLGATGTWVAQSLAAYRREEPLP
jgi:3-carboxy-cis,cis-muconate cycloisomerase